LDPTLVGNERRVLVSELSGRSNIAALTAKSGLDDDRELMDRILKEVVRLENDGYQFESAGASFDLLVRRLSGTFTEHFETIKYRVVAGNRNASADTEPDSLLAPGNVFAEAIIKLKVGQDLFFDAAEGHGPVNALDAALRKTLESAYGEILREMRLLDYKVRVVDSGLGTAAHTRVTIESCDAEETWGTIGVSENVIVASWQALTDSVEYKLHKHRDANG
ncbi:MAG: alpha-isopropylmalate synthase regulatory domain-containing protein, partial [Planctomycetota bacterium]